MASTITALPTPPIRTDPVTFSARTDAFLSALPMFVTETNALASSVNADLATVTSLENDATISATNASNSALASANSAIASGASINSPVWVSGTTYVIGDCRWSPINFTTYRRKTNGSGTVDPSIDSSNWVSSVPIYLASKLAMTTISSMTYNSNGTLNVVTYSTGNKVRCGYTSGNLTSVVYTEIDGLTTILTETITYANDNITAVTWS